MPESSFWQRRRVQTFNELRGELRQFLAQQGVAPRVSNDLVLATQEAWNNACQYGAGGTGCDISVSHVDDTVMIEVADRSGGFDFEAIRASWPPDVLADGGRGLFLIAELSDHMEVVQRRQGTLVRIIKALD